MAGGEVPFSVAVEELIRFDWPLQLFERWVLVDDYEIADTNIAKGDKIAMLFGSANRNPRKWENPTNSTSRCISSGVLECPGVHGNARRYSDVDRPRRSVLCHMQDTITDSLHLSR
jgi:hypothetical protein